MPSETSLQELQQALAAFRDDRLDPGQLVPLFLRYPSWVVPGQLTNDGVLFPDTVEVGPGEEWLLIFSSPELLTAMDQTEGLTLGERSVLATGLEVAADCFSMVSAVGMDLGTDHELVIQGELLLQVHELARDVLEPHVAKLIPVIFPYDWVGVEAVLGRPLLNTQNAEPPRCPGVAFGFDEPDGLSLLTPGSHLAQRGIAALEA